MAERPIEGTGPFAISLEGLEKSVYQPLGEKSKKNIFITFFPLLFIHLFLVSDVLITMPVTNLEF